VADAAGRADAAEAELARAFDLAQLPDGFHQDP
jgi:hypothetical protein